MVAQSPASVPRSAELPAADAGLRTGWFRFASGSDRWDWSDEMYAIHGFAVGDVVPTGALVRSHCHRQDRERLEAALRSARAGDAPVSLSYPLVDAAGQERWVVLVASGRTEASEVRGTLTDLTADLGMTAARRADLMIAASAESRATIDQAKGALMLAYGLTGDNAFELLRWHSEHLNVKVRQLARRLLAALAPGSPAPVPVRALLEAAFDGRGAVEVCDPIGGAVPEPPHLALTTERDDSGTRVAARGELDAATAPALVAALSTALRETGDGETVTADLQNVHWVGATGAAHVDRLLRRSAEGRAPLRVLAPTSSAQGDDRAGEPRGGSG